jgi:hypothetical protein
MRCEVVYAGAGESTVEEALDGSFGRALTNVPFAPEALELCDRLSVAIGRSKAAREHPELQAFAFSIRRAELLRLHAQFEALAGESLVLRPRGCVLHFAPANADTLFAYSWIWSALLGNRNIVRLSSRRSDVSRTLESMICDRLADAADPIKLGTLMVSYEHDPDVTARLSALADVRLIFGGDRSVQTIKCVPAKPGTVDVGFVDRLPASTRPT